jgi:hypothetical protein
MSAVRSPSRPIAAPIPETADLGPKMLALTEREQAFVWHLVCNGGDGSKAAVAAGYSDASEAAKVRAWELRQKPKIIEAIHECGWRLLGSVGGPAIYALEQLVMRPEHPDHFKAVTAVLSRIGFHEKSQIDHHHSGVVELNRTDSALEALAYLKSLDVPREKLVEQFGHSGLARYEKMLEERDAKRSMKVIEHVDTVQPKDDGKRGG